MLAALEGSYPSFSANLSSTGLSLKPISILITPMELQMMARNIVKKSEKLVKGNDIIKIMAPRPVRDIIKGKQIRKAVGLCNSPITSNASIIVVIMNCRAKRKVGVLPTPLSSLSVKIGRKIRPRTTKPYATKLRLRRRLSLSISCSLS